MEERIFNTPLGDIHYWTNDAPAGAPELVFLPGLSASHLLFEKQLEYFRNSCRVLVWDAPGHAASRPFRLEFTLRQKAVWLHAVLEREGFTNPVFVGQSMGGYVCQCYAELFRTEMRAFVSIDSAPLQRSYMSWWELKLMKTIEPVYRLYPWKALLSSGSKGCATTAYGQELMRRMMMEYTPGDYSALVGHGYRILAEAIEADLPYRLLCPTMLICGDRDRAGSTKRYNRVWSERAGHPVHWIKGAGHNSNTDAPDEVNKLIGSLIFRD